MLVSAVALVAIGAPPAHATNDPGFKKQYGLNQIGAPAAWTKSAGNGITIAIVDSGVDVDHPDLKGKIVPGRDFADGDDNPDDDSRLKDGSGKAVQGHGTHVAGIAAAITDNGVGIAGTAPFAKIMPLKVFPSNENSPLLGVVSAVPQAIRFAVDNGAKVINLSLGGIQGISLVGIIETPCAEAYNRGALCVVSSGNDGDRPSGYQRGVEFLNVTANDSKGNHASFGQYADTQWSVSAPGVGIYSTYPVELGSYTELQGTSMSAPFAAGTVALLFAQGLSVGQVINKLLSTATPMGNPGVNGAGRINAAAAVGVAPAPATTAPPATTAVTRSPLASGGGSGSGSGTVGDESDPFSGVKTTQGTLPQDDTDADDDVMFAGTPGASPQLDPAAVRKEAPEVSLGLMVGTLAALAVVGGGWGSFTLARRRSAARVS